MRRQPLTIWTILAIALTLIASLALTVIPLGVGPGTVPWPNFTICVVYFWLVHRPTGLPMLAVLATGLVHDLIGGGVIGAGMLALFLPTLFLRPVAKPLDMAAFVVRWAAFGLFGAVVFTFEWGLTALSPGMAPPIGAPLAQLLVTVLAYPIVSVLFRRVIRIGRT